MRAKLAVPAIAALLASGSACAVSASSRPLPSGCRVIGGEMLPAESGGAAALCKAIETAAARRAPGLGYDIEVRVFPRSRLSASVTMSDGRKLPEQSFVRMDKPLSSGAFERFAAAIAAELAKARTGKS